MKERWEKVIPQRRRLLRRTDAARTSTSQRKPLMANPSFAIYKWQANPRPSYSIYNRTTIRRPISLSDASPAAEKEEGCGTRQWYDCFF